MLRSVTSFLFAPLFVSLLLLGCGEQEQQTPKRKPINKTTSTDSGDMSTGGVNNFPSGTNTNTGGTTTDGTIPGTTTGGTTTGGDTTTGDTTGGGTTQPSGGLSWKVVVMTGDDSINAFDNARKKIAQLVQDRGVKPENIKHLSAMKSQQTGGVMASTKANFESALTSLTANDPNAACFIHMTSHGSRQGFILGKQTILPNEMDSIVTKGCGDRPTVLLVSSCYSGVHITSASSKPNRIILTAAHKDQTSFGCSSEETYVYWDTCFIDLFPKAQNWAGLATDIEACIKAKESKGNFDPSKPQKFFGSQMTNATIFSTTKLMDYYDTI